MTGTESSTKVDTRDANYMAVHQWLIRNYGSADHCSNDVNHTEYIFQWANVTGVYERDVKNFRQLCRSCHCKLDYSEYQREFHRKRMTGNTHNRVGIEQYTKDGKLLKTYPSFGIAAKRLGISRSAISNAVTGRSKIAGGYKWRRVTA